MREILFRGKRPSDSKWVRGYYQQYPQGYVHIQNDNLDWTPVIPETVGQYVGRKDRNGRKIFEGDVVKSSWGYSGVVEFDSFIYAMCEGMVSEDIEIIGNIFDNPDLAVSRR